MKNQCGWIIKQQGKAIKTCGAKTQAGATLCPKHAALLAKIQQEQQPK